MAGFTRGASQEWAVLFYLCGHFNRPGERDPFVAALDEIRQVAATPQTSAAVYLDLESGARRMAMRPGEEPESEAIGAVNSGDPRTLEAFLAWAFDACPAKRYILVMAGLGILDADSVVGRPPFDTTRTFSICDDRATDDAIELHELSAALRAAFPADGARRLVLLACDMYAMQFMEVAYELQSAVDFLVGIQPDERSDAPGLPHWPYARLLRRWQELVATKPAGAQPRWRTGVDPHGAILARETIGIVAELYGAAPGAGSPVTVSAVNLHALTPLAQALDTFSVVYLQWLSNDVMWRARERVFSDFRRTLESAWSYDLDVVATAVGWALEAEAAEAVVHWAADNLPTLAYPRLSDALRVLGTATREIAADAAEAEACGEIAEKIAECRWAVERVIASTIAPEEAGEGPKPGEIPAMVSALFAAAPDSSGSGAAQTSGPGPLPVRHAQTWGRIITRARTRLAAPQSAELTDIIDGIDAARQIGRLAARVAELVRAPATSEQSVIVAVWPPKARCGLSLYRPVDLDRLAESNYLNLRFSRELHWTALLTAVDLINNHARMLWRLVESQLTAAPLEARYQLMRRLAGARALTGRHADQLRALSAPDALFLSIEPVDASLQTFGAAAGSSAPAVDDSVVSYCVRLNSLERAATVVERRNPVPRERLERVLKEIDAIGSNPGAEPASALERLARCGSLLGDDILYGIGERLADIPSSDGRPVHLVLQMPRELMRYPWELLRDRHGWLIERFAVGRQVISDADSVPRWFGTRRNGPLRFLVVAPSVGGSGAEVSNVGILEGEHVADCFERLHERLPGLVESTGFREYIDKPVTVECFRTLLREGRFDIVHFAGHGRYDAVRPDRSCWMFSDGPLYAFELRHTLANAQVTPWLLYGSACEGSREADARGQGYHDGVYGMASAALGQGVAAYVGPLWKIAETDAKNLAADFYEALLLRRTSVGEALAVARRRLKNEHSAGWTGMVLYGDPTPTVLQRLSPSEPEAASAGHEEPDARGSRVPDPGSRIPGLEDLEMT
ncbi:MAG TPA: CHAT domain-containing protein [Vicinamibacterales bacterium]